MQNEERLHDMKVQLTTVQGNHKESMEQLGEKSQQVALLKNDMSITQQQNQSLSDEVRTLFVTLSLQHAVVVLTEHLDTLNIWTTLLCYQINKLFFCIYFWTCSNQYAM